MVPSSSKFVNLMLFLLHGTLGIKCAHTRHLPHYVMDKNCETMELLGINMAYRCT